MPEWFQRAVSAWKERRDRYLPTFRRASQLCDDFCRRWRRLNNAARTLVLFLLIAPPIGAFMWMACSDGTDVANNQFVALLALFLSLFDIGLGFVVLITLEGIKSTDEFLENVIEMLQQAQNRDEFLIIAPTFNIEAKKNRFLFSRYRSLLLKRLKEGVKVTVAYYENSIDPHKFLLKTGADKTTELNLRTGTPFVQFHWQALENPAEETTHSARYFTGCYQFLADLRTEKVIELIYTKPATSAQGVHPVFIGNITKEDYFLGEFTVNESLPQDVRVNCEGERLRNRHVANCLEGFLRKNAGDTPQPGVRAAVAPAATVKPPIP